MIVLARLRGPRGDFFANPQGRSCGPECMVSTPEGVSTAIAANQKRLKVVGGDGLEPPTYWM